MPRALVRRMCSGAKRVLALLGHWGHSHLPGQSVVFAANAGRLSGMVFLVLDQVERQDAGEQQRIVLATVDIDTIRGG